MSGHEFLLSDRSAAQDLVHAIEQRLAVADGGTHATERTYYDTFDALLRDAGLSAAVEGGELELIDRDSGEVRLRAPIPRVANHNPVFASDLDPGPLRDALTDAAEARALLPLVHVRCREHALRVLDDERKTVVRITLREPSMLDRQGRRHSLAPRVHAVAVRGYEQELGQVELVLRHELGLTAADQPLLDEAIRAAGGTPEGVSSKISVPLLFDERADRAAARVLRRLLEVIEANFEGTVADTDSEFLHDYRVSVRRSRSVQRELKRVFPPEELARFREEFRWLQRVTGDSRDLDVYVEGFDSMRAVVPETMRADLDPLLEVLRRRRTIARREMVRALRSKKAASLLSRWASFLDSLEQLPIDDRPDAARPIGEVAGERIGKVYRRMVKMGKAIDQASPAEEYHELRKRGKELRYLLELFGAQVYPQDVVKPMIKALKALQDVLGRHQDREVQVALLSALGDEVAARHGGAPALMATGVLVAKLAEDEVAARGEFAERFASFASKEQRRLVKETFR